MTPDEHWLAANWRFVRACLPAAPARVVEVGCGPLGGFVPMLESAGYQATGIDPEAPPGSSYRKVEFECYEVPGPVGAIVACASLHHVADLAVVLDLVDAVLVPDGLVVIVEWARHRQGLAGGHRAADGLVAEVALRPQGDDRFLRVLAVSVLERLLQGAQLGAVHGDTPIYGAGQRAPSSAMRSATR